ncbi:hypothetical protein [Halorubrum tebenquichense]|uniref:Uncharacterized protein n=1 Tax=Halorubrum tebenquichense DSM 14210 TaxID=1227485 RepID=M0E236_9EURY|nr:hypothetical protein [Halorubrum tebenquichense]ELZ41860.1 hypothetical protein C472_00414 [Halorubrum tebenquichense DSM 14210]
MNRGATVAAVSLAVLLIGMTATPALAAVAPTDTATAQVENASETGFDAPGPFDINELRTGGNQPSAAPPSVRYVGGETAAGTVAIRHVPADPLSNEPVFLQRGATLNADEIEVYSTVFGEEATGEYEAVIVYWKPETETVNGSTIEYAAEQEVQRATIDIESGYASAPIALNSHYDASWEATMWLERDGELVDGARWRFTHESAPASQQVQIETQADAWWYAFTTVLIPGIAGIIGGLSGAKATLKLAGTGPRYSLATWGIVSGFGVLMALAGLYYEVSTVVANFDILLGLSLLPIAYGGGLRMSPPTERIAFERKELSSALSLRRGDDGTDPESDVVPDGGETATASDRIEIPDEGYHDELYEDMSILTTVRAPNGGRLLPKKGIRPFFARLFASAARLDLSDLRTKVKVSGSVSEKVYTDPEADVAVDHKPAYLRRRMPVWHRLPEPDEGESLSPVTRGLYGLLTAATLALPVIGWYAGGTVMNTPTVGAGVGLVLLAVESYEAVDGSIDFVPAPRHDITADGSLTVLQTEHANARTIEDFEEIAWNERMTTAMEARDIETRRDKSTVLRFLENELGLDLDVEDIDEPDTEPTDFEFEDKGRRDAAEGDDD